MQANLKKISHPSLEGMHTCGDVSQPSQLTTPSAKIGAIYGQLVTADQLSQMDQKQLNRTPSQKCFVHLKPTAVPATTAITMASCCTVMSSSAYANLDPSYSLKCTAGFTTTTTTTTMSTIANSKVGTCSFYQYPHMRCSKGHLHIILAESALVRLMICICWGVSLFTK